MQHTTQLRHHIEHIWEAPGFVSYVEKHVKHPARTIKKGAILFSDGDLLEHLYFIKEGFIKLYQVTESGRESIAYLYGPGYVLGLRALLSKDNLAKHNAETLTDMRVITLSHREYADIVSEHPEFLIDLVHYFQYRLDYTEGRIEGFISTDTTARIAYFFCDFIEKFCPKTLAQQQGEQPIMLPIPFTHQRIAEFIGSFRETVTLSLHQLEKAGVLHTKRGVVTIQNYKKLCAYATTEK